MNKISATEYRDLLRAALPASTDTDTEGTHRNTLYTPASHRSALDPDVTVVKGARGVGKTYWFDSLLNDELRELAADEYQLDRLRRVVPLPGFATGGNSGKYPGRRTLASFARQKIEPLDIWEAVGLTALGVRELSELNWSERLQWLQENPEKAEREQDAADRSAREEGVTKLILFDALEHLHSDRKIADMMTSGILEYALKLRLSTRNLRAKVFIRHDMLDSALLDFPDASKLTANAADLTWGVQDLYGLLFQHLANTGSSLSRRFREQTGFWKGNGGRWIPPGDLAGSADKQSSAFIDIAGPYMGTNHRKGHSYPWLPNHLADGNDQTSPRTFLVALRAAAEDTVNKYADHQYALHWDAIRRGVQRASQIRVVELREDQPWVAGAIEPLKGLQVPIERDVVVQHWQKFGSVDTLVHVTDETPAGPVSDTFPKLIEELIQLGMMTRRADGRLDLPDVYRIAFNLGRKGGVPRVRR